MKRTLAVLILMLISFAVNAQTAIQPTFVDSVVMRDGKKIAVDIYIPDTSAGHTYPVILVQTPYNRVVYRTIGLPLFGNNIAGSSYAMLIADWRCFYGSTAACAGNYDRGLDGYDLVEWIATQSWCNGKVGTWGPSALGRIQFMTAKKNPPHLYCCVPLVAGPQYNYSEYYPGGVYRTEYVQQLDALGFGSSVTLLANPTYNTLWQYSEATTFYTDSIQVPTLMIGGWYDHNIDVMLSFFEGIRTSSPLSVRNKHRLLMGPWTHGGHGPTGVGSAQQGQLFYYNAVGWNDSLALLHFDHYLLNIANGWDASPVIQYYQMGENTWNTSPSWPTPDILPNTLYLHHDGSINEAQPTQPGDFLNLTYDPAHPSPTLGGPTLRADLEQGPFDQAPQVESGNDVLVFTSVTLGQNVVMKGKAEIHLFVSSDRRDTDFTVRLTDVYPDGRSMLITDGIRRMRFRNGFTAADTASMQADSIYEAVIDLPASSITFLAGHKIRIVISSSDYPRFDANLNNGKTMYVAGDTLVAHNKVYVNQQYASYVKLPLADFHGNIQDVSDNESNYELYPNPTNGQSTLDIFSVEAGEALLSLFNISGTQFWQKNMMLHSGKNSCKILSADMAAGTYFLKIVHKTRVTVKKIIIIK